MGVEGFNIDEQLVLPYLKAEHEIDWHEGDFDLSAVKDGKCREINNMVDFHVFDVEARRDIDPDGKWLSARWENQLRGDEVRCRYVSREFKKLDPTRDDVFTPASEPTTNRVIDFTAVKRAWLVLLGDAVNAYFNAVEKELVYCNPPQ